MPRGRPKRSTREGEQLEEQASKREKKEGEGEGGEEDEGGESGGEDGGAVGEEVSMIPESRLVPEETPFKSEEWKKNRTGKRKRAWRGAKNVASKDPPSTYSYSAIASGPPLKPPLKLCDFTGLPAPYQDPQTKLRYAKAELFGKARSLHNDQVAAYLAARGIRQTLK
mmetsp:Transcript_29851/g.77051  ORF Transcript_29851/g.77051 Transcript_29851/m.77051 type:complete len:168 (-) Transcript_29851:712-1215(-)